MKLVNVDDVLRILHKYGEYIFVTDGERYRNMTDEIANLKGLEQELSTIEELEKITNEILNLEDEETDLNDEYEFGKYQGYKCCELLIGNHIYKLKGEQK